MKIQLKYQPHLILGWMDKMDEERFDGVGGCIMMFKDKVCVCDGRLMLLFPAEIGVEERFTAIPLRAFKEAYVQAKKDKLTEVEIKKEKGVNDFKAATTKMFGFAQKFFGEFKKENLIFTDAIGINGIMLGDACTMMGVQKNGTGIRMFLLGLGKAVLIKPLDMDNKALGIIMPVRLPDDFKSIALMIDNKKKQVEQIRQSIERTKTYCDKELKAISVELKKISAKSKFYNMVKEIKEVEERLEKREKQIHELTEELTLYKGALSFINLSDHSVLNLMKNLNNYMSKFSGETWRGKIQDFAKEIISKKEGKKE